MTEEASPVAIPEATSCFCCEHVRVVEAPQQTLSSSCSISSSSSSSTQPPITTTMTFHEETLCHKTLLHITSSSSSSAAAAASTGVAGAASNKLPKIDYSAFFLNASTCPAKSCFLRGRRSINMKNRNNNPTKHVSWGVPSSTTRTSSSQETTVTETIYTIPHYKDYTPNEMKNIWYQSKEYQSMKQECRQTRDFIISSSSSSQQQNHQQRQYLLPSSFDEICVRGLEEDVDDKLRHTIGRRQRKSISIVLEKQRQRRKRCHKQESSSSSSSSNNDSNHMVLEDDNHHDTTTAATTATTTDDDDWSLLVSKLYQDVTQDARRDAYTQGCRDEQAVRQIRKHHQQQQQHQQGNSQHQHHEEMVMKEERGDRLQQRHNTSNPKKLSSTSSSSSGAAGVGQSSIVGNVPLHTRRHVLARSA